MITQQQTTSSDNQQKNLQQSSAQPLTWIEVDAKALAHNIAQYKSIVKNTLLAPVIKSNAYGHGIELIAKLLDENSNVDFLCTVSLSESLLLRSIGIKKPLLVLSIIDGDLHQAAQQDIALILYDMRTALAINEAGKKCNKKIAVHIKVDTGLSRLGLLATHVIPFIKELCLLPFISIQGIFTHFATSERTDQTHTDGQIAQFTNIIYQLDQLGIHIPLRHASCSAAITANQASHFTMVRTGIGIYGLWPSAQNKQLTSTIFPHFSLKPVLSWKTTIIQIKEISAGSFVGYDISYQATKPTRIATLPVGYWDGYDRKLSNTGSVLINNQLARVVGRIAMNLMMVDITDIQASVGDQVTLLGNHHTITADDIAHTCQSINYQIVTSINPLLPRICQ
ncbi:MAG: alanine racemase [Candidatus Babeliales bacterium]|nr:alanine racemase [Candidatus Babeliales bacterium]